MDNNGEFENKYDFEKDKDLSKKEGLDLWNKAITQMKSEAKSIVS
jgi:hypothetical protein